MGPIRRPSTTTLIETALDETIAHLTRSDLSPQERAIIIEARRLRSMIASWRAIPPRPAARKEVFANALQLFQKAGVGAPLPPGTTGLTSYPPAPGEPVDAPVDAASAPPSAGASGLPPPASTGPASAEPRSAPGSSARAPLLTVTPPGEIRPTPVEVPAVRMTTKPPSSATRRVKLAPGIMVVRPEGMDWRPFPLIEGIKVKVLHRDLVGGAFRALIRMEPGTELPRHRHSAPEEILVLEGSATCCDVESFAGDYCHADAGTVHEPIRTTGGCTFFLVGSELDELVSV
jgi:quercetin dioxygenase-like cupin family protein